MAAEKICIAHSKATRIETKRDFAAAIGRCGPMENPRETSRSEFGRDRRIGKAAAEEDPRRGSRRSRVQSIARKGVRSAAARSKRGGDRSMRTDGEPARDVAFGIRARSADRESGGGGGSAAGVPTIARSIDRAEGRSKRSGAIEARSRRRRAAKFEGENARSRIGNAGPVRSSVNYGKTS